MYVKRHYTFRMSVAHMPHDKLQVFVEESPAKIEVVERERQRAEIAKRADKGKEKATA
jgi:hypothetical protein